MLVKMRITRGRPLLLLLLIGLLPLPTAQAAESAAKLYVILWFDTEDYLLPASDDAALHLADFLTHEEIRATFKVVGEKARTLERRKRDDVIAALKRHEIGFHSNWHSVQPSPAMYLSTLGWDEGVAEFDRREGPGRADVERIFGQAPTCYGQPGSSWAPPVPSSRTCSIRRSPERQISTPALDARECLAALVSSSLTVK